MVGGAPGNNGTMARPTRPSDVGDATDDPAVVTPVEELIPDDPTVPALRDAAAGCRGCDLWIGATQTVFGEGSEQADVLLLGEQPGDREDLAGRPFVGPAGKLLDRALEDAGIDRLRVFVTNVVKHFKWTPKGKRRIHRKPDLREISACRPWLDAELEVVDPKVVVCLGATAAQALLGKSFRVTVDRGKPIEWAGGRTVVATVHPSSILRARDNDRDEQFAGFVRDLEVVAALVGADAGGAGRRTA
jgi:DNA polymerase